MDRIGSPEEINFSDKEDKEIEKTLENRIKQLQENEKQIGEEIRSLQKQVKNLNKKEQLTKSRSEVFFSEKSFCEECSEEEKRSPAEFYCTDCQESKLLCQTCDKESHQGKFKKHHRIKVHDKTYQIIMKSSSSEPSKREEMLNSNIISIMRDLKKDIEELQQEIRNKYSECKSDIKKKIETLQNILSRKQGAFLKTLKDVKEDLLKELFEFERDLNFPESLDDLEKALTKNPELSKKFEEFLSGRLERFRLIKDNFDQSSIQACSLETAALLESCNDLNIL